MNINVSLRISLTDSISMKMSKYEQESLYEFDCGFESEYE